MNDLFFQLPPTKSRVTLIILAFRIKFALWLFHDLGDQKG